MTADLRSSTGMVVHLLLAVFYKGQGEVDVLKLFIAVLMASSNCGQVQIKGNILVLDSNCE